MIIGIRERMRIFEIRRREDGMAMLQIVGLIIGPIIFAVIGMAAIALWRLGGPDGLTGVFTRDVQMSQMSERMQTQLASITEIDVDSPTKFTVGENPERRTAYGAPGGGQSDVCVSNTWELVPGSWNAENTRTLRNTEQRHEAASCDSPVVSEKSWELPGFTTDTEFDYQNAYGRDLIYAGGTEDTNASTAERPGGLFDNEWLFPEPSLVTLTGDARQPIMGASPVKTTATTPMEQLRPGSIVTDLGSLGGITIARQHLEDDEYRSQFSAITTIDDPRAVIEWSYRWAYNAGTTRQDVDAELKKRFGDNPTQVQRDQLEDELFGAAATSWSDWSELDYHDHTIYQGAKWEIQARYRVVLGNEMAESNESNISSWIRDVATPDPPAAPKITLTGISYPNKMDLSAKIGPVQFACATETVPMARSRYGFAMSPDTIVKPGAYTTGRTPLTITASKVREGERISAWSGAQCTGAFDDSDWSADSQESRQTQPIVTPPNKGTIETTTTLVAPKLISQAQVTGCPDGTQLQVRYRYSYNGEKDLTENWSAWSGWSDVKEGRVEQTVHSNIREGDRGRGSLGVRCVTDNVPGTPGVTDPPIVSDDDDAWTVRPIVTKPAVTDVTSELSDAADSASKVMLVTTGKIAGCLEHLTYQGHNRAANSSGNYYSGDYTGGSWGSWTAYAATKAGTLSYETVGTVIREGDRARASLGARCVSPYTQGPVVNKDDQGWSIRSIASKPTFTITNTLSDDKLSAVVTVDSCPEYLQYGTRVSAKRDEQSAWQPDLATLAYKNASKGATTYKDLITGIGEGKRAQAGAHVICRSPFTDGPQVGKTADWVIRDATAPTISDAVMRAISSGSSSYAASAKATACASGVQLQTRVRTAYNGDGWGSYSGWTNTGAGTIGGSSIGNVFGNSNMVSRVYEGNRARAEIGVKCVGTYTQSSIEKADTGWEIRPVTAPAMGTVTSKISGSTLVTSADIPACATSTDLKVGNRGRKDAGDWSSWTSYKVATGGTVSRNTATGVQEGHRAQGALRAFCDGLYADSTTVEKSDSSYTIRPITTKPTLGTVTSTLSGATLTSVATVAGCPAGTTMQGRHSWMKNDNVGPFADNWSGFGSGPSAGFASGKLTRTISTDVKEGYRARGALSIRCVTDYAAGDPVNKADQGWTIRDVTAPSLSKPVMVLRDTQDAYLTASIGTCAAGTTRQYRFFALTNDDTFSGSTYNSWATAGSSLNRDTGKNLREGDRAAARLDVRCDGLYKDSSITRNDASWLVRSITTRPSASVSAKLDGASMSVTANVTGCQSHMTYEAKWGYKRNGQDSYTYGDWSATPAGSSTRNVVTGMNQGERARPGVTPRCVTKYADGPNGTWGGDDWVIRPITSKPSVNFTAASINGTAGWSNLDTDVAIAGCATGTDIKIRWLSQKNTTAATWYQKVDWIVLSARTHTRVLQVGLEEGDAGRGKAEARCVSDYATGDVATDTTGWYTRSISTRPTLDSRGAETYIRNGNAGAVQGWLSNVCGNLETEARIQEHVQAGWSGSWGGWVNHGWFRVSPDNRGDQIWWGQHSGVNQGARFEAMIEIRCLNTANKVGSDYPKGAMSTYQSTVDNPIIAVPRNNGTSISINGSGTVNVYSATPAGCPGGTAPRWFANAGYNSSTIYNSSATVAAGTRGYGQSAAGTVYARCYAQGSGLVGPQVSWGTGTSAPRPYPAPSAPSGVTAAGQAVRFCDNTGWGAARVSWNASANASYYEVSYSWNRGSGRASASLTTSGTSTGLNGTGTNGGTIGLSVQVRAVGPGGTSAWSSTSIGQAGGCMQN